MAPNKSMYEDMYGVKAHALRLNVGLSGIEFENKNMGISDLMWQCIWVRGGELGDNITAPTSKMIENIGH
jgi:hypothetical protein